MNLYTSAINAAVAQESGFQQVLAGIVDRLLSLAYFYDRNSQFQESDTANKISQAKRDDPQPLYDDLSGGGGGEAVPELFLFPQDFQGIYRVLAGEVHQRGADEQGQGAADQHDDEHQGGGLQCWLQQS